MQPNGDRIFATFNGRSRVSLPELSLSLLARQRLMWPQLEAGYAALETRLERRLATGDLTVMLQCNPQRLFSTKADVAPGAVKARPCFLCSANLPAGQQAVSYYGQFLVLCNPFPIVSRHFTIAHNEHRPQSLHKMLPTFLQLARDFHPAYALLYNGPQCGASAPDHLHFQALPQASIPVLNEGEKHITKLQEENGVSLLKKVDGPRTSLLVEGKDAKAIAAFIRPLIQAMQRVWPAPLPQSEPMLNLFCLYGEGGWRVIIFPRQKHRPAAYYKSGEEQIMVSPGAVEMGGILVFPREGDYNRLDAALLVNIFQEISLGEELVDKIVAAL